jgi:hypothetical protein
MNDLPQKSTLYESKCCIVNILQAETTTHDPLILHHVFSPSPEKTNSICEMFEKITSPELFQTYCICLIIGWVSSYQLGKIDLYKSHLTKKYAAIPQHLRGNFLTVYENTFFEYNLDTFDIPISSIENLERIIRKHAGLG